VRLLGRHGRAFSRRSQHLQRDDGEDDDAEKPCGDERSRIGGPDGVQLKLSPPVTKKAGMRKP
jgi:hypothetical protein